MKHLMELGICLAFLSLLTSAHPQTVSARVEGKVTDGGKPLAGVTVALTELATGRVFKVRTDKNGRFWLFGAVYDYYQIEVIAATGESLYRPKRSLGPFGSGPTALVIDISQVNVTTTQATSGHEGQAGSGDAAAGQEPKSAKKQIEEPMTRERVNTMNALVEQVNAALKAKNWQKMVAPLQRLIAIAPDNWQFYSGLGDAQLNLGQYEQAVESYHKGITVLESNTTVDPRNPTTDPDKKKLGEAKMLTNEGNALLRLRKNNDAITAFTRAASLDPHSATAYFNICTTQYSAGNVEGALDACDKAIAADPKMAEAWFIKGSLLLATSQTDPDGKIVAPPGTAETLNKYLELQPQGPHANDVRQILERIGSKVETTDHQRAK